MYYGRMQTRTEGLRRHEPLAAFGVELHALGICVTPQTGVLYNFNPGAGEGGISQAFQRFIVVSYRDRCCLRMWRAGFALTIVDFDNWLRRVRQTRGNWPGKPR